MVLSIIIAVIAYLIALGMVIMFGKIIKDSIEAKSWPTVDGRIADVGINPTEKAEGIQFYETRLNYNYNIGNKGYEGKDLDFFEWNHGRLIKEIKLSKYFVGKTVKVYYHPLKPEKSVLEPGLKFKYIYPFFCGVLFVVLCTVVFLNI